MMCHRIGRPPISTIGFGFEIVSSESRLPTPPARMATFMLRPRPAPLQLGRQAGPDHAAAEQLPSSRRENDARILEGGSPEGRGGRPQAPLRQRRLARGHEQLAADGGSREPPELLRILEPVGMRVYEFQLDLLEPPDESRVEPVARSDRLTEGRGVARLVDAVRAQR